MKIFYVLLLGVTLLTACSDGSDNNAAVAPPPPVDPGPVEPPPPTMQSFSAFARSVFADPANSQPRELNGLEFVFDANDDDFADLLR
tara:strand:+ start:25085 stop:25345 length:261 start_codon:yes stop_codon:yes gene_type:complete